MLVLVGGKKESLVGPGEVAADPFNVGDDRSCCGNRVPELVGERSEAVPKISSTLLWRMAPLTPRVTMRSGGGNMRFSLREGDVSAELVAVPDILPGVLPGVRGSGVLWRSWFRVARISGAGVPPVDFGEGGLSSERCVRVESRLDIEGVGSFLISVS